MLSGRSATVLVLCLAPIALPENAWAQRDPIEVQGDMFGGYVDTQVSVPVVTAALPRAGRGSGSSSDEPEVRCTWTQESEYSQSLWDWLEAGEPGGSWWDATCSDGSTYVAVYVPPASDSVPVETRLAASLARKVVNRLQLPAPTVGQSPQGQTLVGLPTWWWVQPSSWQVLRQRTTAGPVWAEVTATPISTSWDPGDGSAPLVCPGPGTPYDQSRPESVQSTDCSYTYRRSSAEQPQTGPEVNDRFFTVTVTTTWEVTWRGTGASSGTLPRLQRTSTFPLAVAQRQTVVTGGSG